ncbi:phosphatidylserine decarboxylase [Thermaerobacillus caldiproteolyticus]|uniref:Phosphatidylserine decarboxylase proenzyme n=1 Tax=Thermaerobacillus caldiproteolyticus TaxID=247480 RepID=A0A7W0BWL4_9BACL|nr:phosphatidylserine decarboxylase [Anoxybacillus caldiproteolyticus]MBA2873561.1 phosphatidylserine decarboxylase [Anoxybacillus caldiproteolyticus]QPA30149.1 phosphatidylserine decarboxylase [Anoxybacillus caldiproteolyticus]
MLKWLYRFMIELTNHSFSSKMIAFFTKSRLSAILIPSYAKIYQINQEEMEKSLHHYETLQQLFIRKLKAGARPIDQTANSIISPVDAVIEDIGTVSENKEIIVKGKTYSIQEMLGSDSAAEKYLNGLFIILYLSPSHYHRIHSPISGVVTRQWSLGHKSYPVNQLGLKYGKKPLSKNYRMITEVNARGRNIAIVKIGAMFVNSIELTHPNDHLVKGEEMAYFSFGSTVVLLFEKDSMELDSRITAPMAIKVGERIGYLK